MDDAQWIRVEFYGRMPEGRVVKDIDPGQVSATLAQAFGFACVDGLTVAVAQRPGVTAERGT